MGPALFSGNRERIERVTPKLCLRQDLCLRHRLSHYLFGRRQAVDRASVKRTLLGIVAFEMTGVDHYAANHPRQAQTNDAPVKSRCAAPARLPTVHPLSEIGVFAFDEDR